MPLSSLALAKPFPERPLPERARVSGKGIES